MGDASETRITRYDSSHVMAFDLLKLVGSVVIVFHHSDYLYGFLNRGYIAVELFFIISGYLLYHAYQNHPQINTAHYCCRRAKRFFPEYWFAWAVLLAGCLAGGRKTYSHWYSPIFELLMLQNLGIPVELEAINYPAWYLSVLLYGGTAVYALLRRLPQKQFNLLAAITAAGTYFCMMMRSAQIEQWDTIAYVLYVPFWRGLADMFIGTLLYQLPKPRKSVGWVLELISGAGILFLLKAKGDFDYLALGLIILLVWAVRSEYAILNRIAEFRLVRWFGKYQYGFYLNHIAVVLAFRRLVIIQRVGTALALAAMIFCVLAMAWMGNHFVKFFGKQITKLCKLLFRTHV